VGGVQTQAKFQVTKEGPGGGPVAKSQMDS